MHKSLFASNKPLFSNNLHPGALRMLSAGMASFLALGLLAGCGEEPQEAPPTPHEFELTVTATDADKNPVINAPVVLDDKIIGHTDKEGVYSATIMEYENTEITLGIGPMKEYLIPKTTTIHTTLTRVNTIEGYSNTPVLLDAHLESKKKDYLVWLKVDCAAEVADKHCQNMPILKDGEEIAQTDDEGRAHFEIKGVAGDTVDIGLKTPVYKPASGDKPTDVFDIEPANPTFSVKLGNRAEVLMLEQTFKDPIAAERMEKTKKARAAANRRAAARRAQSAKKQKAKEKEKAGVIDLW